MINEKYISNKIIELRNAYEWSQSELSRRSGVTSSAISQIEKGGRIPSLLVIKKLSCALNSSVSQLIGEATTTPIDLPRILIGRFSGIDELNDHDQKIVQLIIKRLNEGVKNENDR